MADMDSVKKLKIAELRKELTDRGLSSKGNKAELVERLTTVLEDDGGGDAIENEIDADAVLNAEDDGEDLLIPEEDLEEEGDDEDGTEAEKNVVLEPDRIEKIEAAPPKKLIVAASMPLTDVEKKSLRAQKFGHMPLSDADRKKARAERFGMQGSQATSTPQGKGISMSVDTDKLKQRAERFGTSVSPTVIKTDEAERIRKRKERFGAVTTTGLKASTMSSGDDAEAKKRKRAERFGMA